MPRGGHAATSLPPVISGVEGVAVAVVGRLADGLHPSEAFITVAVVVLDLLGGDSVGVSVDHDLLLPLGRRRLRRGSAASASLLVRLPEPLVRGAGATRAMSSWTRAERIQCCRIAAVFGCCCCEGVGGGGCDFASLVAVAGEAAVAGAAAACGLSSLLAE